MPKATNNSATTIKMGVLKKKRPVIFLEAM